MASLAQFERDEHQNMYAVNESREVHADPHPGVPLVLADRYEVLEEIGSGATAVTYRGQDLRLHRNVAIKILRADHALDAGYVQRFEREARAAASISQGNVVDVYDFGEQGDLLYIVMQYIDGEDLKQMIARRGVLEPERAREVTTHVLAGLTAIHAAGIIHRDIKPQNVLIGRDGIARVTDFGVAQVAIDAGLTSAGTTVGTAAYMAPEQAQAGTLGETTDIYAVGVVLYEMLTGQLPFTAPTPVAMMLAHIQREPLPPSRKAPERQIPEDLDAIVMQAMAKDPRDRFQSARAMSRAVAGMAAPALSSTALTTVPAAAHSLDRARQTNAAPREPIPATWPASSAATALPPRVTFHPARTGPRLRSSAGAAFLFLALAVAGGGAYGASEWFGRDNGSPDDRVPIVRGVAPVGTPSPTPTSAATVPGVVPGLDEPAEPGIVTATSEPVGSDGPTATAVPTQTSAEPSPTPEPTTPPTTVAPTQVPPTAVPPTSVPPTAVPPTRVPPTNVPPTAVPPTAVPPTDVPVAVPTDAPVEQPTIASAGGPPAQRGQASNVAKRASQATGANPQGTQPPGVAGGGIVPSGSTSSSSTVQGAGATQAADTITIGSNDWKGDGDKKKSPDRDWTVVGPGEEATARFDVDGTPAGGNVEVSIALAAVDDMQGPLRILLNGTERLQITDPLPVISTDAEGQTLGTLVLTVPSAFLQDGRNEITIVNGGNAETDDDGDGDDDDDAIESGSIVLGDAIVTLGPES